LQFGMTDPTAFVFAVIRKFWAWKESVHVHCIVYGFVQFTQSGYDIDCYIIFTVCSVYTCTHLHSAHKATLASHSSLLYVHSIFQATLLGSFSWNPFMDVFTDSLLNMKGQSEYFLSCTLPVSQKHCIEWNITDFSLTEELWNSHTVVLAG
jgi:hypothetical protein